MINPTNIRGTTYLKAVVSVGLLLYILYSINLTQILSQLRETNLVLFILSVVVGVVGVAISSKRWQILLQSKGETVPFYKVFNSYYIGAFFNLFLPSTVGGDFVKAFSMSSNLEAKVEAYSSIFMDRLTGIFALMLLAGVGLTFQMDIIGPKLFVSIMAVFVGVTGLTVAIFWDRTFNLILSIISYIPLDIANKLIALHESVHLFKEVPRKLGLAVILSVMFQISAVLINYILAASIDLAIPILYFFVMLPVVQIILFIPISIQGYGVREVLYIAFLSEIGVSPIQAVSLSILVQIFILIKNSIGGGIYLFVLFFTEDAGHQ